MIQAVITAPTRELALQIYNRCEKMSEADPKLRIRLITGGMEKSRMNEQLKVQPHIVVGKMKKNLQMMSFSATIPVALQQFLKKYMDNPSTVHIQEQSDFHPKIEHVLIPCQEKSYEEKLMELLATFTPYVCLIFANTRTQAASVAGMMRDAGYGIIELW